MDDLPGIYAQWNFETVTPAEIEKRTDDLIKSYGAKYDQVGSIKAEDVTFENTIQTLIGLECELYTNESPLEFLQNVSPDKAIRDASVAADKKLSAFGVELSMKKDIFDNICAFKDKFGLDGLTDEQKRWVERAIIDGKRSGLHLDKEKRDQITAVKKKIADLETQFSFNLNEDTSCVYLSIEELEGVPQDLIDSFEKNDEGKCKVTMQYPQFFPSSKKAKRSETRKRLETCYQSRCLVDNTKILEELVELRQQQADLLGYANHASYVHELRMAKKPENVTKFLSELAAKLQPLWSEERKELLELKQKECQENGWEFDGKLNFWDMKYYCNMLEETKYSVDQQKLKEYFPLPKVTEGLLKIYQDLLSLKFQLIENVRLWHEDVTLYSVKDKDSDELLGYFCLDLHPREGKYGHACVNPVQPGCLRTADGKKQAAFAAMLANFSKPTEDKPSLLDHGEVETFFHEFGHVMHSICSKAETAKFFGTSVERDFVEAPSQMLENWCWEEETLKLMSGHYKDGSEIPSELMESLVKSRLASAAAFNLRQIILGTFDLRIHTTGKANTADTFRDTYKEIIGIDTIPNTSMPANFGHMVGYASQYYGYLWSEVFCHDMFAARFKKEGLLNTKVGMDYRNCILRPGGSKDALDMLKDFLGREPTQDAFLRAKGLN